MRRQTLRAPVNSVANVTVYYAFSPAYLELPCLSIQYSFQKCQVGAGYNGRAQETVAR